MESSGRHRGGNLGMHAALMARGSPEGVGGVAPLSEVPPEGLAWQPTPLDDESRIIRALGHLPWNAHAVAAREAHGEGKPTVLELYPISAESREGKGYRRRLTPCPTLFWLICPELKAAVSSLEAVGLIPIVRRHVAENQSLRDAFRRQHGEYGELRWRTLAKQDQDLAAQLGWEPRLHSTGVSGMIDFTQVKCLHTHYAHFLATGENVVGAWVQRALDTGLHVEAMSALRDHASPSAAAGSLLRARAPLLVDESLVGYPLAGGLAATGDPTEGHGR